MDRAWWNKYAAEIAAQFKGALVSQLERQRGVQCVQFPTRPNSGAGAIALAVHWGAERVIMLGYDCQKTNGQAHWHGDHPAGLGNAGMVHKWPEQFRALAQALPAGVEVFNCSRTTALDVFPRRKLEEVLL